MFWDIKNFNFALWSVFDTIIFGSSFKSQIVYDAYPIGVSHRALLSCAHIKISQFSPACFGENLQIFKLHIWTS